MQRNLNKSLCGFSKVYSTQHTLFKLLILMDLSKAYDCIPHGLFKANLKAYDLDKIILNIPFGYLKNHK